MKNSLKSLVLGLALALAAMGFAVAMPLAVRSFTQVTQKQAEPVVKVDPSPRPVVTPETSKPAEIILPEIDRGKKRPSAPSSHGDRAGRDGKAVADRGRQGKGGPPRGGHPQSPQGGVAEAGDRRGVQDSKSSADPASNKPQKGPKASKGPKEPEERQGPTDPSSDGPKKPEGSKEPKPPEGSDDSEVTDEPTESEDSDSKGRDDDSDEEAGGDAAEEDDDAAEPESDESADDAGSKGKGKGKGSAAGRLTAPGQQEASSGLPTAPSAEGV